MRIYGCDRCAVVTNSRFTPSACEAGAKTGCLLVAGDHMRDLIFGQIILEE
jgi:hypothetical protein